MNNTIKASVVSGELELVLQTSNKNGDEKEWYNKEIPCFMIVIILSIAIILSVVIYTWVFRKVLIFSQIRSQDFLNALWKEIYYLVPLFHVVYFGIRDLCPNCNNWGNLLKNGIYQFIFNFSAALFGWISLCGVLGLYYKGLLTTGGGAIFSSLLFLIAITGISGNLPQIILTVKLGK